MAKKAKAKKPQDLTQYSLRGLRRRLARSEERLDMIESVVVELQRIAAKKKR